MDAFLRMFKKYWYIVLVVVLVVTLASFFISYFQKAEYKSSVKLLVIQRQEGQIDAYTAARSAETIAQILSDVVYTSTFYDQVMNSGFEISKVTFSTDAEERKEEWKRAIDARVIEENGTMQIDVYDESRKQSEQLAYAIAYVMINNGDQYHGGEENIDIKMIDAPIASEKPARPNIIINTAAGFLLGLLASLSIIFLLSERQGRAEADEFEVKMMPRIDKRSDTGEVEEYTNEESIPEDAEKQEAPRQEDMVKNRIMKELGKVEKIQEGSTQQEKYQSQEEAFQEVKPDIRKKEVSSRLAEGMTNIGTSGAHGSQKADEIIYTPEDIEDEYQEDDKKKKEKKGKPQEDKYSSEKVEQWIKTGKFE